MHGSLRHLREAPNSEHAIHGDGRPVPGEVRPRTLAEVEKDHIEMMLAFSGWNKADAARRLGVSKKVLNKRIEGYGITRPSASGEAWPQLGPEAK